MADETCLKDLRILNLTSEEGGAPEDLGEAVESKVDDLAGGVRVG